MNHSTLLRTALRTLIELGAAGTASSAFADHEQEEQCASVIKAGKNGCARSSNACDVHVTTDSNPESWICVLKGTREMIGR